MNVLIADDEPMTRALLRRVLTRVCGCTVAEAADGLAALSSCGAARPDLIVTDLRMPVMDGIELIEALRQVPALATIPVVMMTAAREQAPVHRAIELGVTDYLLKPLQAERVADRLRSVVERVTRAADGPEEDRSPVLVADGDAEFRHSVAAALGPLRPVHQAQSGVAALQRAVETRPGVILVGGELGLLGPELLMRKLRAASELADARIVAIVGRPEAPVPDQADAVLVRTTNADVLRARFHDAAASAAKNAGLLAGHPSLRAQIAAAAEQVLGMTLGLDVRHSLEVEPRPVPRVVSASVALELPEARQRLNLVLRTDPASAARVAAALKPADPAASSPAEEPAAAAAAEVLGIIAGRIKATLETAGRTVAVQPPTHAVGDAGDLSEGAEGRMQVTVQAADRSLQFVLQMTSSTTDASPADPPAPGATS